MKIGITERGDAGIDLSWQYRLNTINGAILITKKITDDFIKAVINAHTTGYKLIVHCTCTGWGGSAFEPNVWDYKKQLTQLKKLINAGFPATNCVLRIDPIFPTENGLKRIKEMLDWYMTEIYPSIQLTRYRISVYDEYKHVKERLKTNGFQPCYDGFYANWEQMKAVGTLLSQYPFQFETCAEDMLARQFTSTFIQQGCISYEDLKIMNITTQDIFDTNGQNRTGCHCLTCKTELLQNKKKMSKPVHLLLLA